MWDQKHVSGEICRAHSQAVALNCLYAKRVFSKTSLFYFQIMMLSAKRQNKSDYMQSCCEASKKSKLFLFNHDTNSFVCKKWNCKFKTKMQALHIKMHVTIKHTLSIGYIRSKSYSPYCFTQAQNSFFLTTPVVPNVFPPRTPDRCQIFPRTPYISRHDPTLNYTLWTLPVYHSTLWMIEVLR